MTYEKTIQSNLLEGLYSKSLEYTIRIQQTGEDRMAITFIGKEGNVIWFSVVTNKQDSFRMSFETGSFHLVTNPSI